MTKEREMIFELCVFGVLSLVAILGARKFLDPIFMTAVELEKRNRK